MKVRLSRKAEADLESIAEWIAKHDPRAAWRFTRRLRAECASLQKMPERNPVHSQKDGEVIRRMIHRQYLIFYRIFGDRIEIIRIIHGAQDYARFLD